MATAKKFNVRHGLSAGTGTELKDVIDNLGKVIDVGTLPDLKTTAKTNTVAAINELYDSLGSSLSISETFEPMGVANRSHSVISFDNSTRTFTISPSPGTASFVVWTKAAKRTYTSAQSVSIGASPATGLYYIYFDPSGVLSYRTTYFDWENDAMVAYVYWNAATNTAPFVADERHGIAMDWATHEYLHRTRGAVIANGFSISNYTTAGDGSLDTHAQFDLGNGTFFDEDLEVNITHSETPTVGTFTQILQGIAEIPVFYHSGAEGSWVRDAPTQFAAKQSATTLQYNTLSQGSWTTTPATDNRYVVSWIVATNEINYPILSILGQNQYSSIGEAEAIGFGGLVLTGFPIVELRPLWKVIFRTSSGYTNTPSAHIANILDIRQLSGESGGGSAVSDHGLLTGLVDDDHAQYLHVSLNRAGVSANISTTGNLGGANLTLTGELRGPSNFIIDPAAVGDNTGTVEIKGNLTVQGTTTTINSTTVDLDHISLGDSEVANFGDSNDLQIYHDGVDSYIRDTATGNLNIYGDNEITIRNGGGNEYKARFITDGAVELYYDGVKKFETASGGVKIQPSSNSQGVLEVQRGTINADSIRLQAGGTVNTYLEYRGYLGHAWFIDQTEVTRITSSGNVGVGTTNPTNKISVGTASSAGISIDWSGQGGPYAVATLHANMQTGEVKVGAVNTSGTHYLTLYSNNSEAVRINSSGNVGIGITNPEVKLQVWNGRANINARDKASTGTTLALSTTDASNRMELLFDHVANSYWRIQSVEQNVTYKPLVFQNDGGNVGVGTTNPTQKLHVEGSLRLGTDPYIQWTSNYLRFQTTNASVPVLEIRESSSGNYEPRMDFYDGDGSTKNISINANPSEPTYFKAGNVGVGTTNPTTKLDVVGAIRAEKYQGVNSLVLNSYQTVNPSSNVFLYSQPNDRDSWIYLDSADTGSNWGIYHRQIDSEVLGLPGNSVGFVGGGNSALKAYISLQSGNAYFSGNVGIGTNSPGALLHLAQSAADAVARIDGGSSNTSFIDFRIAGANKSYVGLGGLTGGSNNDLINYNSSAGNWIAYTNGSERLRITSAGNVGIGTTNPDRALYVNGQARIGGGTDYGTTEVLSVAPGTINFDATGVSGGRFKITSTGLVGINDPSPDLRLSISEVGADITSGQAIFGTNMKGIHIENSLNDNSSLGLWMTTGSHRAGISMQRSDSANTWGTDLRFYTHDDSTTNLAYAYERLRIGPNGNVGIGITNPQTKLGVYSGSDDDGLTLEVGRTPAGGEGPALTFRHNTNNGTSRVFARIKSRMRSGNDASWSSDLSFYTGGNALTENFTIRGDGNVGIGTNVPNYKLEVVGSFAATTKSFVIPHPTKEGHKLRYGSLEGPENGVYVRGRSKEFVIHLPEYWTKLVDPDSITVNLTPIGKTQTLWVKDIKDNKVYVGSRCSEVNYFYTIFAERVDVEKLEVEI